MTQNEQAPCVYRILNAQTGGFYIGSTRMGLARRKQHHLNDLRNNKHHCLHLQRSFNKYGEASFYFDVIEFVEDVTTLVEREQHYLDTLSPHFNSAKTAAGNYHKTSGWVGKKHKPETIVKMTGQKRSTQTRENISTAMKGKKRTAFSDDARQRMSHAHVGNKHSEETLGKIRGHRHTDEAKEKIRSAKLGVPRSEETRRKMSEATATLSDNQVIEFRKMHARKGVSVSDIAKTYEIDYRIVYRAVTGKSHKHLPMEA